MPITLESFLADHAGEILTLWAERVRASRSVVPGAPLAEAEVERSVRGAYDDLLAAVRQQPVGVAATNGRFVLETRADTSPPRNLAQADTLLALVAGREVLRDLLTRQLSPDDAAARLPDLAAGFDRVVASYGRVGCARCLSVQDESRQRIERRLETVVEHSLDAIVLCDEEGVIEAWNRGAAQLLGRTAEEMLGRCLGSLSPQGNDGAWLPALLARVREEGHARFPDTPLVGPKGERLWVDASYTRVRDPGGRQIGLWAVFRDMTEQRRLIEDNLQAERLALIGTMSAKFAHEIRNPLASILLNLDLIRDALQRHPAHGPAAAVATGEDEEIVDSIAHEVERIQHVVQDYLRFARLPRVQRHAVELDDVLRLGLGLLAPEFKQHGVTLELALDGGERPVAADADQIWQVVMNLARNAMEALPRGGHLAVMTTPGPTGVECVVEDDGPGIPLEVQDRIFVPFFSTKHAGTGLGLPFVRQVLAEHRSALRLDSAPGQGARFSFVLPYADAD